MTVDVALCVTGIDLDDETTGDILANNFPDLLWEEYEDLTIATMFVDHEAIAEAVLEKARHMESALPGVKVVKTYRDFVTISDIAHRIGMTREGVRKWTHEAGFPTPESVIGPKSVKIWTWSEIVGWIHSSRGVDMDQNLPTVEEMTQIDNCLMRNPDATTVQWEAVRVDQQFTQFRQASRAEAIVIPIAGWRAEIRGRSSNAVPATSSEAVRSC